LVFSSQLSLYYTAKKYFPYSVIQRFFLFFFFSGNENNKKQQKKLSQLFIKK